MTNKSDDKNTLRYIQQGLNSEVSMVLKKKLENMLSGFRQDLAAHPYLHGRQTNKNRIRRISLPFTISRNRVILMIGAGLACVGILMTIIFVNHTPTWAEVEEQFGIIESCSLTAYVRHNPQNPFGNPTVSQYWFGRDGRARFHFGNFVVFHSKYSPVQSFDITLRRRGYPMNALDNFLRKFEKDRKAGTSTLRSIMESLTGEGLIDTTELVITDAQVAQDLMVFDARSRDRLWWLRVWALRKSKLPIRILKWHQKNSRYIELIFTYSKEQPAKFFNPDAFAEALENPSVNSYRLLHLFLQDPGGQAFPTAGS